jgi:ATP-dependent DNA helicase RecQ
VLRQVRRPKAADMGVAPFIIFSDAALRDMSCRKPRDHESFLQVQGMSHRKWDAFGEEFLAVIRDYCESQTATAGDSRQEGN